MTRRNDMLRRRKGQYSVFNISQTSFFDTGISVMRWPTQREYRAGQLFDTRRVHALFVLSEPEDQYRRQV